MPDNLFAAPAAMTAMSACAEATEHACCSSGVALGERNFESEGPTHFFSHLFDTSDFPARWYCGTWSSDVGWLHVASDIAIFGAYFAIPCVLMYFLLKAKDIAFPHVVWLFAAFILSCGFGHLLEALIFWWPAYRLAGLLKAITAVVSWVTVGVLAYLIPKALALPSAARLSRETREREQLLQSIVTASPCLIFWKDKDGRLAGGNEMFAAAMQLEDSSEIEGIDDRRLGFDRHDIERYHADDMKVIQEGRSLIGYEESVRIEGELRHFRTSKVPLFDERGDVSGLLGISEDITERKQQEARLVSERVERERVLQEAEARFAALTSSDIIGIITCSLSGPIYEANDEFLRIVGYSRSDLAEGLLDWTTLTPEEHREADSTAVEDLLSDGFAKPWKKEYLRADGSRIPVLIGASLVRGSSDQCVCFVLDSTDQVQTELDLRNAKDRAEDANTAKSEFLANMSHEIRTPLNGVLGFTEVMLRKRMSESQSREFLETIRSSGNHLLTLINDILDLSKVEAGRLDFDIAPCSPQRVISEVMSVLRVRAEEKCISLECRWTTGAPTLIASDEARLRQSIMNLVGNAIKFTEYGGVTVVAGLSEAPNRMLTVEVHDTGLGISPEALERIFRPFEQADGSVTRNYGGTGLGLAITKRVVEGLGGSIAVESREKVGSVFTINVPTGAIADEGIVDNGIPEAAFNSSDAIRPVSGPILEGITVLLCEDGRVNRDLIRVVLEDDGATVIAAENGAIGIDQFTTHRDAIDVVLMDMQMPELDGYGATRRLREMDWSGQIIALTANAMRGDREKAERAGCDDYLTKPVDIDELVAAVRKGSQRCSPKYLDCPSNQHTEEIAEDLHVEPIDHTSKGWIFSTLDDGTDLFREIIEEFIDTLPAEIDVIERAVETGDHAAARRFAHTLKGTGGTVGFGVITEVAGRLEAELGTADAERVERCFEELRVLSTRLLTRCRRPDPTPDEQGVAATFFPVDEGDSR